MRREAEDFGRVAHDVPSEIDDVRAVVHERTAAHDFLVVHPRRLELGEAAVAGVGADVGQGADVARGDHVAHQLQRVEIAVIVADR